jgi:hypothetical protein
MYVYDIIICPNMVLIVAFATAGHKSENKLGQKTKRDKEIYLGKNQRELGHSRQLSCSCAGVDVLTNRKEASNQA